MNLMLGDIFVIENSPDIIFLINAVITTFVNHAIILNADGAEEVVEFKNVQFMLLFNVKFIAFKFN